MQPPDVAYRLDEHLEEKEHSRDIEEAIKKLKNSTISIFSIESVISDVEMRQDIDDNVKTAALNLLEEVR
mgnify:CR=1 FL=1